MKNYLENSGVFYHISPYKNLQSIGQKGLIPKNKGICVARTNNQSIINSIINTQLADINDGDRYIVVEITIPQNFFPIYAYEPDILDNTDWTWPLHNNIKVPIIPPDLVTNISEHIYNLEESTYDVNNQQLFVNEDWFLRSYELIYQVHYKMTNRSEIDNLGHKKHVRAYDALGRYLL